MSKEMTNKAAIPGGDSIEEREESIFRGFLVASDGMGEDVKGGSPFKQSGNHGTKLGNRGTWSQAIASYEMAGHVQSHFIEQTEFTTVKACYSIASEF